MPAAHRWYQHVEPATAVIDCEGEGHRVTWRWGKLKLEDHDLGAERAMLVLGGEPSPCLRALQLWSDQFGMNPEQFSQVRRHLGADAVLLPDEFDVPRQVGMALSMERAWKASRYFDQQGRLLERQLRDRALPALRAHLTAAKQAFGSRLIRGAVVDHVAAGRPVLIEGRMDSVSVSARVTLSSDWLVHVWSRGMAVVEGALVVDVTGPGSSPGSVAVRAVRWKPTDREAGVAYAAIEPVEAVRNDEGGWRLSEPFVWARG